MEKRLFGCLPTGEEVFAYTLSDGVSSAEIMDYGATILTLLPFGDTDVVGGFDTLEHYPTDSSNQGATIGRVANRIKDAQFELDGKVYHLPKNDNGNCLHGGSGFNRKLWSVIDYKENSITLSYLSADGEDGFPSALAVEVTYTLQNHSLLISYKAVPDGTTPIALTNHAYFNLNGFKTDIKDHMMTIWADHYTDVRADLIPNGNRPSVESTPFDLREPHRIGEAFSDTFDGYDHNMILSPKFYKEFNGEKLGLAAKVEVDSMIMQVYTDQPGIQFYSGNFLGDGPAFKNGVPQIKHGAFCLEAQTEPDCVNHHEAIYSAGQTYHQLTVYEFLKK